MQLEPAFRGRSVFLTGHTGFKGSWLAEWLVSLGAHVTGYSLPPPTQPALFEQLSLAKRIERHVVADILDANRLASVLLEAQPDFVFHLAAQPLVRESYRAPAATYQVNVIGTIHLLEALRRLERPCAAVFVTTDKCYENRETGHAYTEDDDPLGGHDPYSSSKAAMEIAVSSWRRSFFQDHHVKLATARAGNVIGGGDWAADRIVPDCIRALQAGNPIPVRHPAAVRPWQHVLEPLSGYLSLAARLAPESALAGAYNFGPAEQNDRPVRAVVDEVLRYWPGSWCDVSIPGAVHEAALLHLNIEKSLRQLGWFPIWPFAETVAKTIHWYRTAHTKPASLAALTRHQIEHYTLRARELGAPWAK